jgi:hypothetical protein
MRVSSLALRLLERAAMEALLVRARRSKDGTDPVLATLIVASALASPALVTVLAVCVLTGHGPGLRVLRWSIGAPRQRPRRT